MIDSILSYNKRFVADKGYEQHLTDKFPNKQLAILSCMDCRLTRLLPDALGLKNGDAKIITNAGGVILDPYGSEIRSLLVAVYELGVQYIMVIHHTACGAQFMSGEEMLHAMREKGITDEQIAKAEAQVSLNDWLQGFGDMECDVRRTVETIRQHPLIPAAVCVRGFVMDSATGQLTEIN